MAGIIGAAPHNYNNITYTGVAPEVDFLDAQQSYSNLQSPYDDIVDALRWAKDNGADVINLSMNWDVWEYGWRGEDEMSQFIDTLVDDGIVVVNAAGNAGERRASGQIMGSKGHQTHGFETGALGSTVPGCSEVTISNIVKVTLIWNKEIFSIPPGPPPAHPPAPRLGLEISNVTGPVASSVGTSDLGARAGGNSYSYRQVKFTGIANASYKVRVTGQNLSMPQEYEVWLSKNSYLRVVHK